MHPANSRTECETPSSGDQYLVWICVKLIHSSRVLSSERFPIRRESAALSLSCPYLLLITARLTAMRAAVCNSWQTNATQAPKFVRVKCPPYVPLRQAHDGVLFHDPGPPVYRRTTTHDRHRAR